MIAVACKSKLNDLALYAAGDLQEPAAGAIEKHLARCPDCRRELEALKKSVALSASLSPIAPPEEEFLAGVRARRARIARTRALRYSLIACAAAVVLTVLLAGEFLWGPGNGRGHEAPLAHARPVEVERVGYSEAVVRILPTRSKSMTIVWIVSDEVVTEEK